MSTGRDFAAAAPIIAVTMSSVEYALLGPERTLLVRSVAAAGGIPLMIDAARSQPALRGLLESAAGLIVSGGGDVAPERYGGDPDDPTVGDVDRTRDEVELEALALADELQLPTLAICRGLQLLNVFRGGDLIVDLARDAPSEIRHQPGMPDLVRPAHDVTVTADSRVAAWTGRDGRVAVNSQHHQAIKTLGAGLRVTARADDDIIEGVEDTIGRVVGVQWHPEWIWPTDDHALSLLTGFVGATSGTTPSAASW